MPPWPPGVERRPCPRAVYGILPAPSLAAGRECWKLPYEGAGGCRALPARRTGRAGSRARRGRAARCPGRLAEGIRPSRRDGRRDRHPCEKGLPWNALRSGRGEGGGRRRCRSGRAAERCPVSRKRPASPFPDTAARRAACSFAAALWRSSAPPRAAARGDRIPHAPARQSGLPAMMDARPGACARSTARSRDARMVSRTLGERMRRLDRVCG